MNSEYILESSNINLDIRKQPMTSESAILVNITRNDNIFQEPVDIL